MRRPLALVCCAFAALLAGAAGQARPAAPSWAQADIRIVVSRGLMAKDVASFRPDDTLTQAELNALVAGLTGRPAAPASSSADVTVAQLDARLVAAVGLRESAATFLHGAREAGLAPPSRFGTEVVARLLGLRYNHPTGHDHLELGPDEPVTRAETAYSAARILRFSGREVESVKAGASSFVLPALTPAQTRVLATAVKLIGQPYVWGGTSELPQAPLGKDVKGGFDCSGFLWRVYKLQAYTGTAVGKTIRGRTAAAMAAEVPAGKRVAYARLAPGDLVFFAAGGPRSAPAAVDHAGIYLGGGWMIHASRYGVALASIASGWYRERFAWGRRPLAEAGPA